MKAVILAGGLGTRISEESHLRPKPMVEIGGQPILWHILKIYSSFGINDFVICLGYKGYLVKEYFMNYALHNSNITIDLSKNTVDYHQLNSEPWKITLIETGINTGTGGRLLKISDHLESHSNFCLTYGDGVGNINITKEIAFHNQNQKIGTVCAVKPPGRYGLMELDNHKVASFNEKKLEGGEWVNGGFFVFKQEVLNYINEESDSLEIDVLPRLVNDDQLSAWKHTGYWQPMDTMRDKKVLEDGWSEVPPPWKTWQ